MENDSIASELKLSLLYREDCRNDGAVAKIATLLHLSRRTVYDYLDGRIKISLPFIHACVIATDGDPDVKKLLEPDGWELCPKVKAGSGKATLAEECLDDLQALAEYHRILNRPDSTINDIQRAKTALLKEIAENISAWMRTSKKGVIR